MVPNINNILNKIIFSKNINGIGNIFFQSLQDKHFLMCFTIFIVSILKFSHY